MCAISYGARRVFSTRMDPVEAYVQTIYASEKALF
jgi:hypothetical protein